MTDIMMLARACGPWPLQSELQIVGGADDWGFSTIVLPVGSTMVQGLAALCASRTATWADGWGYSVVGMTDDDLASSATYVVDENLLRLVAELEAMAQDAAARDAAWPGGGRDERADCAAELRAAADAARLAWEKLCALENARTW